MSKIDLNAKSGHFVFRNVVYHKSKGTYSLGNRKVSYSRYKMKNICTVPSIQYCILHIHVDALETERTEKIMPPRNRMLLEQRQRIIQAFEDVSEDYLTVAATIGVNRSTLIGTALKSCKKSRLCQLGHIWTARSHGRARLGERAHRQVCGRRRRNVTVALVISPTNGLVFHSAFLGGMTGQRFNDFLTQARLNLDPNEHVIFIYDGAPAHNNPAIPGPNSELKKLSPYSPFLNIVEKAINALKAAIKADISRPEQQEKMNNGKEARRQGIALGNFRTQLLLHTLQRNIGTITAAKCGQWYRFTQTYIPRCLNSEEIEG
ncbi:uncharacterized protein LOC141863090 [Acropora palmata]|uniref:uncharacterized protein LOC141863090 n=1 Tax=Acropora palmata TaxID=6131 RepID=UPI003D9FB959